ncbi:hypothetical protein B0H10DRAFT_1938285 [Mycena sp. CBHHK59/15]|nr:hypothetical protein B0H10DRAFT_1938285 [Mycena sp. CBHHK59/15]
MPSIHSQLVANRASGRKSKVQCVLQVNLGPPFHLVLDTDSDLETPSPLPICFDLPKPVLLPIKSYATEWLDSDSDSDEDTDLDASVHVQHISLPAGNPFYCPPPPPSFKTSFELRNTRPPVRCAPSPWQATTEAGRHDTAATDAQYIYIPAGNRFHAPPPPPPSKSAFDLRDILPPVPFACQALATEKAAAQVFHAELTRIMPRGRRRFVVDAECVRGMDAELFAARRSIASARSCPDVPDDDCDDEVPRAQLLPDVVPRPAAGQRRLCATRLVRAVFQTCVV